MTASRVQGKSNIAFTTTTVTATLDAPATVGNIIVVGVRATASVTINTPTDDKSHTYSAALAQVDNGVLRARMYYAVQTTGGMTQVTATVSANANVEITVDEFAGVQRVNPLGTASSGTGTTETSWSVASFSPTAGSLIVAFGTVNAAANFTAGTNYTLALDGTSSASEYRLSSTTTETAPLTTGTAGTLWIEVAAEFLPAVAVTATLSGTGTLSASATITVPVTSTMSGTGTLAATLTVTTPVAATLSGAGSIAGSPTITTPVTATIGGAGNLNADATISVPVTATLSGVGSQTADVSITVNATASISGAGDIAGTPDITVNMTATLSGTAGTGGSPTITTGIAAILSGTGTLRGTVLEAAARGVIRITDALKVWLGMTDRPAARVAVSDERKARMHVSDRGEG